MQAEDNRLRTTATTARQKSDEAKASQAASKSQSSVLTSLTKLKDQGRLPGFHVSAHLLHQTPSCALADSSFYRVDWVISDELTTNTTSPSRRPVERVSTISSLTRSPVDNSVSSICARTISVARVSCVSIASTLAICDQSPRPTTRLDSSISSLSRTRNTLQPSSRSYRIHWSHRISTRPIGLRSQAILRRGDGESSHSMARSSIRPEQCREEEVDRRREG